MFMFFMWLATTIIGELLAPKVKYNKPTPAGIGDILVTTAETGRVVPVAYGTPLLKGANCTWYGDLRVDPITEKVRTGWFSKQTVTKGYRYFMGAQLVFCRGFSPGSVAAGSGVVELRIDDLRFTAMEQQEGGTYQETSYTTELVGEAATRFARIKIVDNDLFGGDEKSGGFSGTVDFHLGQGGQEPNDYLQGVFDDGAISAYRGFCYAVLRQCYIGTTEYPKMLSAVVRHHPWFWSTTLDLARDIDGDANPISIILDLLTNRDYGLGYSFDDLDIEGSFRSAADSCANEGVGLSLVYDTLASASDLIEDVLRHIDGIMYVDPSTGKFKMKLARPDYDIAGLPRLNVDNVLTLKLVRASWGDTKNIVKVRYTNREDNYEVGVVEVKNQANIDVRGGQRAEDTYDFLGLSTPAAANKVAARVLKTVSTPMARITLTVNREAFDMYRGSVFALDWTPLGISNMACRITRINYGDLTKPEIEIEAVEDIFGMLTTQITAPQAESTWIDPVLVAVPLNVADRIVEVPYYLAGSELRQVMSLGTRANGMVLGYNVELLQGSQYVQTATGVPSTPSGTLVAAIPRAVEDLTFTVAMPLDSHLLDDVDAAGRYTGENLLLIDDELMAFATVAINTDGTVTIGGAVRAVLDSVPAAHALGARVWFVSEGAGLVRDTAFEADITVTAGLRPFASRGKYFGGVPLTYVTTISRAMRPYPPGAVLLNGLYAPSEFSGSASLTWAHRSKEQQLASRQLVSQASTSGALGEGTEYSVDVLVGGNVARTVPGIAGSGFSYTPEMRAADNPDGTKAVVLRLSAVKGGLASTAQETSPFVMTGLGMSLGMALGGAEPM